MKKKEQKPYEKYKFLVIILIISSFLMFSNLGNRFMAGDEVHTVMIAQSVQETGLPKATYNNQLVYYNQLNDLIDNTSIRPQLSGNNLIRAQSWSYFYVGALSFSLFGVSNFSARFPFALIGIATIILFYSYITLIKSNKKNSSISFVIASILLFHSNYAVFLALFLGILLHFFVFKHYKNKQNLFKLIKSLCIIFLFTFPWFYYLGIFSYSSGEMASILSYLFYAATGFFYIFAVMGFPYIFLFFIPSLLKKNNKLRENHFLILIAIISFILVLSLHNEPIQVRYLISLLPLICLLNGSIIAKIEQKKKILAYAAIILLISSNILLIFPFNFIKNPLSNQLSEKYEKTDAGYFIDRALIIRLPFIDYLYEITHDYRSAEQEAIESLSEYSRDDLTFEDYFISNSEGFTKTLMFHTNMKYIENQEQLKTIKPILIFFWQAGPISEYEENKEKRFMDFINEKINLEDYDLTVIRYPNIKYAETPNPIHHRYGLDDTEKQGQILVYHLRQPL